MKLLIVMSVGKPTFSLSEVFIFQKAKRSFLLYTIKKRTKSSQYILTANTAPSVSEGMSSRMRVNSLLQKQNKRLD